MTSQPRKASPPRSRDRNESAPLGAPAGSGPRARRLTRPLAVPLAQPILVSAAHHIASWSLVVAGRARVAPFRVEAAWARGAWRIRARRVSRGAWARLTSVVRAAAPVSLGVFYRLSMLVIAAGLVWAIWRVQEVTGAGGTATFDGPWWQESLRWLEILWLAPAPLALMLWAGWLGWAGAARRDPTPQPAPAMAVRVDGPATARLPARLVFRIVTRGEQVETLRASVEAARAAMRATPAPQTARRGARAAPYRIEIVSDQLLPALAAADCAVYTIPAGYETPHRSLFKARALTYLQEVSPPRDDEWRLYLDEESRVSVTTVAGVYAFIARAEREQAHAGPEAKRRVGQGAILYQGGSAFFRAADALRTGDDLGRFRLQYGLGAPVFGAHGSFLLVRALDEAELSFDVGERNSVTEDAAWAVRAWSRGWRFGWIEGYLREQPPQRVMDFVRQRARWLTGIRRVALDTSIPLGYRMTLLVFTALWQLAFVPLVVTLAALATHTPPVAWMRLPGDITWATFALAYLQGLDTQAARAARERAWPGPAWLRPLWTLWARAREWPLALGVFWYSILEMFAVVYSMRRDGGFFVIAKPLLSSPSVSPGPVAPARGGAHA